MDDLTKGKQQGYATLVVTLRKSLIGRRVKHKASAMGLGLRRIGQTCRVVGTPENRGMIEQIRYLLDVQESACPERQKEVSATTVEDSETVGRERREQ